MNYKYETFRIPSNKKKAAYLLKKKGIKKKDLHMFMKYRVIESPNLELKARQSQILAGLYRIKEIRPSPFCHGFMPYRNVVSAAYSHVGQPWVIGVDVKDFFPSVRADKFMDILARRFNNPGSTMPFYFHDMMRYCFKLKGNFNTILKNQQKWGLKNVQNENELYHKYYVDGNRELQNLFYLPQGAPTSPYLSNIFLRSFDWIIARRFVPTVEYSRYADDLNFSCEKKEEFTKFFPFLKGVLKSYGLELNPKKTRFLSKAVRQSVCGVVVNEKLHPSRRFRRNMRAQLHNCGGNVRKLNRHQKGERAYLDMFKKLPMDARKSSTVVALVNIQNVLAGNGSTI